MSGCTFTRLTAAILLGAILGSPSTAHADDLDDLLAMPVSPGTLGLMVVHVKDARVGARWREALVHPSPQVRATAARLLLASGDSKAVPDLARMLATDASPLAALEAARGLILMGAGPVDGAVLSAAKRLNDSRLALAIVSARGPSMIGQLSELRPFFDERGLPGLITALARDDAAALDRLADHSLRESDEKLWYHLLGFVHDSRLKLASERVASALAHASPVIRACTWWHVAVTKAASSVTGEVSRDPATDALEGVPANLAFGRDLANRVLTARKGPAAALTPRRSDEPWPIPSFGMRGLGGPLFDWLEVSEREILGITKLEFATPPVAATALPDHPTIRTVADLPEGLIEDVLKISRCDPSGPVVLAGASVRYNSVRHLQALQWLSTPLKSGCADAARAILAAGLVPAPESVKAGDRYLIVLPMNRPFLRCLAGTVAMTKPTGTVGTNGILPPRKIKHVNPEYPQASYDLRRQGIVVIESTIAPTGCVERLVVVRGVALDLDAEAIRAVSGWAFSPTLLRGTPVPVIMTVTVQFTLQ